MTTLREWCVSHLVHLALTDAFGCSLDAKKSKNEAAREIINKTRKQVESINKSEITQGAFEEASRNAFNSYLKLKNAPQHRWSSTALVLERVLMCWPEIELACNNTNKPFILAGDKKVLTEFYSIIVPIRKVQTMAQAMKSFTVLDVYVLLTNVLHDVLNERQPLEIIVPRRRCLGDPVDPTPNEKRAHRELDPRSQTVRCLLRKALCERYYNRYHPILALVSPSSIFALDSRGNPQPTKVRYDSSDLRFSYLFDMQALLHPAMCTGRMLTKLINGVPIEPSLVPAGWSVEELRSHHIKATMGFLWGTIKNLAERVADHALSQRAQIPSPTIAAITTDGRPRPKKPKLADSLLEIWKTMTKTTPESRQTTRCQRDRQSQQVWRLLKESKYGLSSVLCNRWFSGTTV